MKRFCKHFSGGGNFETRTQLLKGLLSLLLTTSAFTACTNESEVFKQSSPKLDVKFGVALQQARAIFTDASLPSGSVVGAMLDDGTATDYDSYSPLYFTATGAGDSQTWAPNTDVVLTETKGTLYAYYPHDGNVDISAIPVDMTAADQTDWLYATPVADVNEDNASVAVTLNHAAANINVTINKGTYLGEGNISNITVQSDGIALGGTFNAAQATPGYTAFEGEGEPLSRDLTTTTGAATDIMVVPNGTEAAITFLATIDGIQFTATSAAVTLEKGNSYQYTLNLSDISTYMTVGAFGVNEWTINNNDSLDLKIPSVIKIYAMTADEEVIDYNTADNSCIGVVLHATGQNFNKKFLINKEFFGGVLLTDNYSGVTTWDTLDGLNSSGYLPNPDGSFGGSTHLSEDFTTWTEGALSDFNGKYNTTCLTLGEDIQYKDSYMPYILKNYNDEELANGRPNDWYIPACGQLALIAVAYNEINKAMYKIGKPNFNNCSVVWSSTRQASFKFWEIILSNRFIKSYGANNSNYIIFLRDIE